MSTARWGTKWADADDETSSDEEGQDKSKADAGGARFETQADENGIKLVIEYKERDGKTFKVTKKVKQTITTKRTNKAMTERKTMAKFGKVITNDPAEEAMHVKQMDEDVNVEFSRKTVTLAAKDDVEEKFFEESIAVCESLFKERKVWTDENRSKQMERDADPTGIRAVLDEKKDQPAAGPNAGPTPAEGNRYVPPSMRGKDGGGKGDGKGGKDFQQQQEASLRITNLSEDAKEGDLQELFGQFGRLQRVYIAKDRETGYPRGFAFITYYNRQDAQKAIDKLHGHGYDNLILQVSFAKPKE